MEMKLGQFFAVARFGGHEEVSPESRVVSPADSNALAFSRCDFADLLRSQRSDDLGHGRRHAQCHLRHGSIPARFATRRWLFRA